MASLIEGYEYDIFVSYRQKDNKYDGWVTEFVNNLQKELEATFKEEISVYFDIDPHDGLLETHDVNASLKDKLKCLVFIPIISRTYCDPKSFAWEHEFKAFIDLASRDQFGLKIKLPGGNVANRVLPVQIHELDTDDRKLVESELGGFLRGIEFIYKEPGVNRPLMSNENHPDNNLNKTFYRNQINKVANAINEIITGLKNPDREGKKISLVIDEEKRSLRGKLRTKIISSLILLALIVAGYFIIPRLIKPKEQLEKSIAVLPFKNDSPDSTNTYFINGIMEDILNNLQKIKDMRVISRTSVEQFRNNTAKSIPDIAKELGVNYIVEGSGQKYGSSIHLSVQLLRAVKEGHLWGNSYDQEIHNAKDIFIIQSQIAQAIASELKAVITSHEKQIIENIPTENIEAYNAYQMGRFYWRKLTSNDLNTALQYFELAKEKDPDYALAYAGICYYWLGAQQMGIVSPSEAGPKAVLAGEKALELDSTSAEVHYSLAIMKYAVLWDWEGGESEFKKTIELNPNDAEAYAYYSHLLNIVGRSKEAMEKIEVALKLDPRNPLIKGLYGMDLMFVHRYDEAIVAFQEALKGDPTAPPALSNMPEVLHHAGREKEAVQEYRKRYKNPEVLQAFNDGYVKAGYTGAMGHVADVLVKLSKITRVQTTGIAVHYALAGNKDKAIDWLEKAYQEHEPNLPYLLMPCYDKVRDDHRFQDLCHRMNLPYK
jgi:TolB-like protein/Tfp pilus assembly protein PilF